MASASPSQKTGLKTKQGVKGEYGPETMSQKKPGCQHTSKAVHKPNPPYGLQATITIKFFWTRNLQERLVMNSPPPLFFFFLPDCLSGRKLHRSQSRKVFRKQVIVIQTLRKIMYLKTKGHPSFLHSPLRPKLPLSMDCPVVQWSTMCLKCWSGGEPWRCSGDCWARLGG